MPKAGQGDAGPTPAWFEDQQQLVDRLFRTVARRYDLMNDLMSGGLHRAWKNILVNTLNPPKSARRFEVADLAGGTADVALRLLKAGGSGTRVTVLDINTEMLEVGRCRAGAQGFADAIGFVRGNAANLPYPAKRFEAVAIAFGIRNIPWLEAVLSEAFRVLKIGGQFACLEFSQCDVPGLDRLYDLYSFNAIPALGSLVVGDAEPYRYLVESIRRFPRPEGFAALMRTAGLRRVSYTLLSGGIAALHSGWRL